MLNHRFTSVLFIILMVALLVCQFYLHIKVWPYLILLVFVYSVVEFCGAYFIGLNFHLNSVNHLDKSSNRIALTFDDGPCPQSEKVLDTLKKHNVKGTFFVIGKNVKDNSGALKRMTEEGHSVGSHSFSHHFWIDIWPKEKLKNDILKSMVAISEVTGKETKLLRPPYGVTNPQFRKVTKELGLRSIGWNVRSYDTTTDDINIIFERVMSQTKGGSVILLHDRLDYMPALLDKLIPALKEKKFEFVTVS